VAQYTVSSISLNPIPNVHGGTGHHLATRWIVDPTSVPPYEPPPSLGLLRFSQAKLAVTTMLFELLDSGGKVPAVVPNWFGVAIPDGLSDFTKANIFFHPEPGQVRDSKGNLVYKDSDYQKKAGGWPRLFYYMERLGYQLDGARRNQIAIMPFLTQARLDTGILPADWSDIVNGILTAVRATFTGDATPVSVSELVVSSFSVGIVYSDEFRKRANLSPYLAEVWDFDGLFSTASNLSQNLHSTVEYNVIKYDQIVAADLLSYHVPLVRWQNYVTPPKNPGQVHPDIRDTMFLHACTVSNVGSTIGVTPMAPGSPSSRPPQLPSAPGTPIRTPVSPPIGGTHVPPPAAPPGFVPGTHIPPTGPPGTHLPPVQPPGSPPGTHLPPLVSPTLPPGTHVPVSPSFGPRGPVPPTSGPPSVVPGPVPRSLGPPTTAPSPIPPSFGPPAVVPTPQPPLFGPPTITPAPVSPTSGPAVVVPGQPAFGLPPTVPSPQLPGPPSTVPGTVPTPAVPCASFPVPPLHAVLTPMQSSGECCCCTAIVGIASTVAATATTAITAITAIAAGVKKQE
jgi:hypothetical protein